MESHDDTSLESLGWLIREFLAERSQAFRELAELRDKVSSEDSSAVFPQMPIFP